jgi:hypothetical protein
MAAVEILTESNLARNQSHALTLVANALFTSEPTVRREWIERKPTPDQDGVAARRLGWLRDLPPTPVNAGRLDLDKCERFEGVPPTPPAAITLTLSQKNDHEQIKELREFIDDAKRLLPFFQTPAARRLFGPEFQGFSLEELLVEDSEAWPLLLELPLPDLPKE